MWKRVVSSLVGVTLILCAFVGVEKIKSGLPSQKPIELETVGDVPTEDKGPEAAFQVAA